MYDDSLIRYNKVLLLESSSRIMCPHIRGVYMGKKIAKKPAETCLKVRRAYVYELQEFARLLGTSTSSIYMYEHGKRVPRLPIIRKYIELAAVKNIQLGIEDFTD